MFYLLLTKMYESREVIKGTKIKKKMDGLQAPMSYCNCRVTFNCMHFNSQLPTKRQNPNKLRVLTVFKPEELQEKSQVTRISHE